MTEDRRYDVDWLRIGATLLLLPFHTAKVFDVAPYYHVKVARTSEAVGVFTGFVHLFHMPLFFTVAGWALAGSVLRRDLPSLFAERSRRLLLPLAVGCLTFGPFIGWVQHREIEHGSESFLAFVPTFFTSMQRFTWSHLWFLAYLFAFTVIYAPLMRRAARPAAQWDATRLRIVWLVVLPLAMVQVCLRGRWPGFQNLYNDWANFTYYSLFLWAGFLLARVRGAEATVERSRRTLLAVGLAAAAPLAVLGDSPPGFTPSWVAAQSLSALSAVGLVAGAWGYARRLANVDSGARRYLADAAFPVYVLHQPVIVALALVVVYAPASTWWGLPTLTVAATILTLAMYELGVRRSRTLRYALGSPRLPRRPEVNECIRLAAPSTAGPTRPQLAPEAPS